MTDVPGKCHCGNIAYVLRWPGAPSQIAARACGCGFCVKHGGVWTSRPDAQIEVRIQEPAHVSRYRFGTGTADFLVCSRCGVAPLVTCEIDGQLLAVVNVNTFEGVDPASVARSPASFEGEDVESRLARRRQRWIGTVRIT